MQKINFTDPIPSETPEMVVWHNLHECDVNHNLGYFVASSMGWFKLYPTASLQDFERELRQRDYNTHLFGKKPLDEMVQKGNYIIKSPNKSDETLKQYECIYSCRPKQYAIEEVLTNWKSYEESFEKLAETGFITVIDMKKEKKEDIQVGDEHLHILNDSERTKNNFISDNTKKINFITISINDYLSDLIKSITTKFGKAPEQKLVGLTRNGGGIMGLFIDDELVSDIGITMERNQKMELIIGAVKLR